MTFINKLSVKLKIALSFLIAFLIIVIFILLFFPAKQKAQAKQALKDKTISISQMLAASVAPGLEFDDTDMVNDAFESAAQDEDLKFIVIFDSDKNMFASYNYLASQMNFMVPEGKAIIQGDLLIASTAVESAGMRLGTLYIGMSLDRINAQVVGYRMLVIFMGIIILLLGVFVGWWVGRTITLPMVFLADRASEISDRAGDLTSQILVSAEDEVGMLGSAFNRMLDGLRSMIIKVLDTANDVSELVKQLTVSSQDISATTQEVSSTVQEISTGAAQTAKRVDETTHVMEEMTSSVVSLASDSQQAVDKMNDISATVANAMNIVEELAAHSLKIGEFVSVISDIANQTNLLSLNASIEAARAGEAGRGFTVVAEEVKKLAEDSGEAAGQISRLISDIRKKVDAAVENMRASAEKVNEGREVISSVSSQIQDVVSKGARGVEEKITEIAVMSENAASATEETSAATEEITSSMEQMNTLIQQLYARATDLHELVSKFNVGR